ncbi:MAG: type I-E CRISPR-associated protein Cas6/Cse3/CasE, partial [Clostridia bacterium]
MYLSVISMDRTCLQVRRALSDRNALHRDLMRALPDDIGASPRAKSALLYQLCQTDGKPRLYVLCQVLPEWVRLAPMGYRTEGVKDVSALQETLTTGRRLAFDLLCTPTKKVVGDGKNSRRVFLRTTEERTAWLCRQGEKYGFSILAQEERNEESIYGRKNQNVIQYTAVHFRGLLKIDDAEKFWVCFCQGIGSGKAYGL